MSLPSQLYDRLYNTLLRCDHFRNDDALESVFVDARISQWAADLPEANSQGERARATIKYLADKQNIQGENALVLLLRVLCDGRQPTDGLHRELAELASELEQHVPTPSTQQWDAALERYRERVKEHYSTMRVLGKHKSVPLEGIYTDVYILDKPQAARRFPQVYPCGRVQD